MGVCHWGGSPLSQLPLGDLVPLEAIANLRPGLPRSSWDSQGAIPSLTRSTYAENAKHISLLNFNLVLLTDITLGPMLPLKRTSFTVPGYAGMS